VVITSNRTRSELEFYRKKLAITHPFISENGGCAFIPLDYFNFPFLYSDINETYKTIELGLPYVEFRKILKSVEHRLNCKLRGFGDMSADEISEICEIPIEEAKLAKVREYEEPFMLEDIERKDEVIDCIRWAKVNIRKEGKLYYITGDNDKGKAIKLLTSLYEKEYGTILTVGIGRKEEDISILKQCKVVALLPLSDGTHASIKIENKTVEKIEEPGPEGWRKAVLDVVSRFGP